MVARKQAPKGALRLVEGEIRYFQFFTLLHGMVRDDAHAVKPSFGALEMPGWPRKLRARRCGQWHD
jgi:hypothetical protein